MAIAEGKVAGVAMDATTLGMSEKNAPIAGNQSKGKLSMAFRGSSASSDNILRSPAATPVSMTKTIKGPTLPLKGQTSNKLIALAPKAIMSELMGPIQSANWPKAMRPTADARLNPAARPAEEECERPIEVPYNGRKNGGTKSGNVPSAEATKTVT